MSSPPKHHRVAVTPAAPPPTTDGNDSDNESVGPVLPLAADTTSEEKKEPEPVAPAAGGRRGTAKTRARSAAAAASSTADKSTPAAASSGPATKKRKLTDVVSAASDSTGPRSKEDAAASRIQAMIRGAKARSAHKQATLWNAWNELDWKEEQALMNSNSAYEALKKAVTTRVEAEKSGKAKGGKASSKKRATSPAGGSPKKGKGKSKGLTPEEEETACGLLLRDKDPLTFAWVTTAMEHFRLNKQLPQSLVYKLLARVSPILQAQPNLVDVQCTARITVVGDLHGQLDDLLAIFKLNGLPSPRNRYLFNGDFVDRGQHSIECVLTLFAWKILMPHDVMLNRGNHEARDINGRDGFERECLTKYANDVGIFDAFSKCFAYLPLGHIFDSQVLVIHGGLFPDCPSLQEIQELDRVHEVPPSGSTMEYLMWSDPKQGKGREESPRGAGLLFGADVTKEFLKKNNLQLIVRSHECMTHGHKSHHNDTVITVFSASNYCGTVGNDGALVVFERDGETSMTLPLKPKTSSRPSSPAMGAAAAAHAGGAASTSTGVAPLRSSRLAAKELAVAAPAASSSGTAQGQQAQPPAHSLNRRIFQFYAAKKEKQSAYRVVGGSNLESDIITKLLHIISDHRLHLVDYWTKHSQPHTTGIRTVTRAAWAAGLKSVLGLSIPFLEFQDLLGLPKLGVDGRPKGSIDFMAFLARFRPVNLVVLRAQRRARDRAASQSQMSLDPTQETQEPPMDEDMTGDVPTAAADGGDDPALASLQTILELLHKNRFELESLFRYLDYDGDESISHDEFREGIKALEGSLQTKFTRSQIDSLLEYIDSDHDGSITYAEFLNSFELQDPVFQPHLIRSKSIRDGRLGRTDELGVEVASSSADEPMAESSRSLSPQHGDSAVNDAADHDSTSTPLAKRQRRRTQ